MSKVPPTLEICLVLPRKGSRYPGLFLFTTPARMLRPVINLQIGEIEYIGTFEQVINIFISSNLQKKKINKNKKIK